MRNNFKNIRTLMNFDNEGDFYFIQIIKRRKDAGNEDMRKGESTVEYFYIYSFEDFDKMEPKILASTERNNARAYFLINKRNTKRIALETNKLIAEYLVSEQYTAIKSVYTRACGRFNSAGKGNRKWLIDADTPTEISDTREFLLSINAEILMELPTKNGLHFITKPFNVTLFANRFGNADDIKKDNGTLLTWV
jgi:hypothetical protein